MVAAANELCADILVIPSIGCGVFHNDPLVIGGCLGEALAEAQPGSLKEVVLTGHHGFVGACRRTFYGQDPREPCPEGVSCTNQGKPQHAARFFHTEAAADTFEEIYYNIVAYPEQEAQPLCRYGKLCRIVDPEHRKRFSHPGELQQPLVPPNNGASKTSDLDLRPPKIAETNSIQDT